MREIKFRIWDRKTNKLYHSSQLVIRPYSGNITDGAISLTDSVDVEQFTGLQDRNGVEIFEGDYIGIKGNVVEWSEDCWTLNSDRRLSHFLDFEVIGNIHEEPTCS